MSPLRFTRVDDDRVSLSGIDAVTAACLREVPKILERAKDAPIRERLFLDPVRGDDRFNEDWRETIVPEIEHLFASAGETLAKDIAPLAKFRGALSFRQLVFPSSHVEAWLRALNLARIILGTTAKVTEEDYRTVEFADPKDKKQRAMFRLHYLTNTVGYLIDFLSQGPEEAGTDESVEETDEPPPSDTSEKDDRGGEI